MPEPKRNYVDGEWVVAESGDTVDVHNPADTTEVVNTYQHGSTADAEVAVAAVEPGLCGPDVGGIRVEKKVRILRGGLVI
jgi:acyl-CoA reductase-like NAD-dependent aldehyde dehydrogenase